MTSPHDVRRTWIPDVRAVRAGESITLPAEDSVGFVRRPAPCDGYYVTTDEIALFVPADVIARAEEARR